MEIACEGSSGGCLPSVKRIVFGQWDVFAFCRLLQLKLFKPPSVEIVTSGQIRFSCAWKKHQLLVNLKKNFPPLALLPRSSPSDPI